MFIDIFNGLLTEQSLNRKQFAEKSGIPYPTVIGWTNLSRLPDYTALKKIADFFGCSADYLLERDEFSDEYSPLSLTTDEQQLLLAYKKADIKTRASILQLITKITQED